MSVVFGTNGPDNLTGTPNVDTIWGAEGDDSFLFSGDETGTDGSGGPIIADFEGLDFGGGTDRDRLVFSTGLETGSFTYVGSQAFNGAGNSEARFAANDQFLVDSDGDGSSDMAFRITGVTAANQVTSADFLWL